MSPKVSERTYKTEAAFRREIERRLSIAVPDSLWAEKGRSRWLDAELEQGCAFLDDVNFVVTQFRRKRRTGELPPPVKITGEPKDLQMWWLRSRFTGWCLEPRAREWRRKFIPPTLPASSEDEWVEAERGIIKQESVRVWMQGLARFEDGFFIGKPVVRGGPNLQLPGESQIYFSFPDTDAPRFIHKQGAPEIWWSASPRLGGRLELVARLGPAGQVWPTVWAIRLMEGLTREWDWIKLGTDWSLADAAGFYIFGATPTLSPMSAHVTSGFDSVGWGKKITIEVDPRISPDEVKIFYSGVLTSEKPPRAQTRARRALPPHKIELVDFVLARTQSGQRQAWGDLWSEWQEHLDTAVPRRSYTSARDFARVFQRAIKKLYGEGAPSP